MRRFALRVLLSLVAVSFFEVDAVRAVDLGCDSPFSLIVSPGVPRSFSGDTTGQPTLADQYPTCVPWSEYGPEVVHPITTTAIRAELTATLSNLEGNDLDVFILNACDSDACLTYGDIGTTLSQAPPANYYVAVDGFGVDEFGARGPYTLDVSAECSPAIPLELGVPYFGETNGGLPSAVREYSCSPWDESGPEIIHQVTTYVPGDLQAELTGTDADLDVFILASCEAAACLAYGDASAVYPDAPPGSYTIVVDGFNGAEGGYTLTVTGNPCETLDCNDDDECTLDSCNPESGTCENEAIVCDDGDLCTDDICDAGMCLFVPHECADGDLCTVDSCNPETGDCAFEPILCNDDDLCTDDVCVAGGCEFIPQDCNDGNLCTLDACDPASGVCGNPWICGPPQITSAPVEIATVGVLYQYDVEASDPDDHGIEFVLDESPPGMTIDPGSGLIEWLPGPGDVGGHGVAVRALDETGEADFQAFVVDVINRAPNGTIEGPPPVITIETGGTLEFFGSGVDPDGHVPLTYHWSFGAGSGIPDSSLEVPGPARFDAPGLFVVSLTVTDSLGLSDPSPATTEVLVTRSPVITPESQADALQRLREDATSEPQIRFERGLPRFVDVVVPIPGSLPDDPVVRTLDFLDRYRELYRLPEPRTQLFLKRVVSDDDGGKHVFYGQHRGGIPVFAAELATHTNGDEILGSNGATLDEIPWFPAPIVSSVEAEAIAEQQARGHDLELGGETRPMIFNEGLITGEAGETRLAWRVTIRGVRTGDEVGTAWVYLIDAHSGDVLWWSDLTESSAANPDFDIRTAANTSSNNCWNGTTLTRWFDENGVTAGYPGSFPGGDADGDDAFEATDEVYDYYFDEFHRHSWNGNASNEADIDVKVHVGTSWENALYSRTCDHLLFGEGMVARDILAHEYTHAVNRWSRELLGSDQPGALNESYADVFAMMVDDDDWSLGEDAQSGALRVVDDPTQNRSAWGPVPIFQHPDHMDNFFTRADLEIEWITVSNTWLGDGDGVCDANERANNWCETYDLGGVHVNNGIPNKVAYLLAEGGSHYGITISGIGRARTQRLYYDVLTSRLTSSSQFRDARDLTVKLAKDYVKNSNKYGFTTSHVCDVINAFASVGLGPLDADCDGQEDDSGSDRDGDFHKDASDNCPDHANPGQEDIDGDGEGDVCDDDDDGDGVPDQSDNCRAVANANQADADGDDIGDLCEDADKDGVHDDDDNCPNVPNASQYDNDKDGQGDACDPDDDDDTVLDVNDNCRWKKNLDQADGDGDGVGNACDNCVGTQNPQQWDADFDGLGDACDPDADNDGVANDDDNCPFIYNPSQTDADANGQGLACDANEKLWYLVTLRRLDVQLPEALLDPRIIRLPLPSCMSCPDWLPENFQMLLDVESPYEDVQMRVVDDRGWVVAKGGTGAMQSLPYRVTPDAHFRAPAALPGSGASADELGGSGADEHESSDDGTYRGRQYTLEIYPSPEMVPGEVVAIYTMIAVDRDGDFMSDDYETRHGLDPDFDDSDLDFDSDGSSNIDEMRSGSDPTDQASTPATFIDFDSLPDGTRVKEQYANLGVHFVNDYEAGAFYRASPQIRVDIANAHSTPKVLVNHSYDDEIQSSSNVPLAVWFDQPVAGVGMWLGTADTSQFICDGPISATVSVYDCAGALISQQTVDARSDFSTPLQILDSQEEIQKLVIDYGASFCPEAIDDLAFMAGTGSCNDTTPPKVSITSHSANQTVNSASQTIQGTIEEPGIIASVEINGQAAPFHLGGDGKYTFSKRVTLDEGGNSFTVLAKNVSGGKGSASVTLSLGAPVTASVKEFHLTQRGIMKADACDIDTPFVTGKFTIVKVALDVQTATGASTYASNVEMTIRRKGQTSPVGTLYGTQTSPALSSFSATSQMAGVHFWVPGSMLATADDYEFEFQAYQGLDKIGPAVKASCGDSFAIADTRPIRFLILPVEAGMSSKTLGPNHTKWVMAQLDSLARNFPVRDFSNGGDSGVVYHEISPFHLCDGSAAMAAKDKNYCGNGWTWKFIDKHPSGLLRRADDETVVDPKLQACNKDDHKLGGRIRSSTTYTLAFDPALGIFRGGAHPGWKGAKHVPPLDDDHDGDIDANDLKHYIAELDEVRTIIDPSGMPLTFSFWSPNLSNYDQGETFRFFNDKDNDDCNDYKTSEPQADVRKVWDNAQKLLWGPANDALQAFNKVMPGTANDMEFASLVFPVDLTAFYDPPFGSYGPGQGKSPGKLTWVVLRNTSTFPHELGHNVGDLKDEYYDKVDDDLVTKENATAAYIYYESVAPSKVFITMGADRAADRVVHLDTHYQVLFDKLKLPVSTGGGGTAETDDPHFIATGWIDAADGSARLRTQVSSGHEATAPDAEGRHQFVFGAGSDVLGEHRFSAEDEIAPPDGFDSWPQPEFHFHIVTPYPVGTEWVELRDGEGLLARFDRSPNAPTVELRNPIGGEHFGAEDEVLIQWLSDDADADEISHDVYYSPDGGEHWSVLATGLVGNELLWKLVDGSGTTPAGGLVKVVASDGFQDGEDTNDELFTVDGKPPTVVILAPSPNRVFLECEPVYVRGVVHDPERQPPGEVSWSLDGESVDGGLVVELAPLPPGSHTISLRAVDADGLVDASEVAIVVAADSDCDGMADEFEEAHGLEPGLAEDAMWDLDEDGLFNLDEAWHGTDPDDPDSDHDGTSDGDELRLGGDPTNPDITPEVCDGIDNDGDERIDEGFLDGDGDELADCVDACPDDARKIQPGTCGCGVDDGDSDADGEADCIDLDLTVVLAAGFNLISSPAQPQSLPDAYSFLTAAGPSVTSVQRYDRQGAVVETAERQGDGSVTGTNFALIGGEGLIVLASEAGTIELSQRDCPSFDLQPGMNWVGSPCAPVYATAFEWLQAIGDGTTAISIERFDPVTGEFETAGTFDGAPAGANFPIRAGEGYMMGWPR